MGDKYQTRYLTLPNGFTVRTVLTKDENALTDEEFFEKHPALKEIAERWAAEEQENSSGTAAS